MFSAFVAVLESQPSVSRAAAVPLPESWPKPSRAPEGVCVPPCSGLPNESPRLFPAGQRTLWCSGGVDHTYIAASPRSPFWICFSQGGSSESHVSLGELSFHVKERSASSWSACHCAGQRGAPTPAACTYEYLPRATSSVFSV